MNEKKHVKAYLQFLCLTYLNRIILSFDFNILAAYDKQGRLFLKRAISLGHIRNVHFKEKDKDSNNYHTIDAYSITKEGIRYLRDNYPHIWFETMTDEEIELVDIFHQAERSAAGKLRIINQSTAVIMAMMAGANIPLDTFTETQIMVPHEEYDEDDVQEVLPGHVLLRTYLRNSLPEYLYNELEIGQKQDDEESSKMVFHNGAVVKLNAGQANKYVNVTEYVRARFKGIVDTDVKSVLLYVAPPFSMSWQKWVATTELNAYFLWTREKALASSDAMKRAGSCAGLIVKNAATFTRLYCDAKEKSKASETDVFGGPFNHFYILPENQNGTKQLRWIATTDDQSVRSAIIESLITNNGFVESDDKDFPLLNADGYKTAVCFQFDAKNILRIDRVASYHNSENFAVVCFPWQKEYYERVLPSNVYYITAEFNH